MGTKTIIIGLLSIYLSAPAVADEGYLNVKVTKVTCKIVPEKEDRFRVEGVLEGKLGTARGFWGIRYSDRDSNYNYKLGADKEGSHAVYFCDILKAKVEAQEWIHLIARSCGYNCNDVRAFLDAVPDPGYGTGNARILK